MMIIVLLFILSSMMLIGRQSPILPFLLLIEWIQLLSKRWSKGFSRHLDQGTQHRSTRALDFWNIKYYINMINFCQISAKSLIFHWEVMKNAFFYIIYWNTTFQLIKHGSTQALDKLLNLLLARLFPEKYHFDEPKLASREWLKVWQQVWDTREFDDLNCR